MFDDEVKAAGGFRQLFELWRSEGRNVADEINRSFSEETGLYEALGFRVTEVGDGYARLEFHFSHMASGRRGRPHVHGGVVMTALDTTCGLAVMSVNTGHEQSTLELKVNFVKPLLRDPFEVTGRVIHIGKNTAVVEGEIVDSEGAVCARALGTWFVFR
ncbi:MAG: PaaI family thioesterase [Conexivisphaera sp.]|jgi:acyl-CoA thioesterase|nr:PaaI family thioesterase [Conexivisphaerales archaeon]